jgi:hypothetical protein
MYTKTFQLKNKTALVLVENSSTKVFIKWFTIDNKNGITEITEWDKNDNNLTTLFSEITIWCENRNLTLWSY